MFIKYSEILEWKDRHCYSFQFNLKWTKGFWMNISYHVLWCNWVCHSQALGLCFLIWKNNVMALFHTEPFLTPPPPHLFPRGTEQDLGIQIGLMRSNGLWFCKILQVLLRLCFGSHSQLWPGNTCMLLSPPTAITPHHYLSGIHTGFFTFSLQGKFP